MGWRTTLPAKYDDTFEENIKNLIKARLEGKDVFPGGKAQQGSACRPDGGLKAKLGADGREKGDAGAGGSGAAGVVGGQAQEIGCFAKKSTKNLHEVVVRAF